MLIAVEARLIYALHAPAPLLFAVEIAPSADQRLIGEQLTVRGCDALVPADDPAGSGRRTWTHGRGMVDALYVATVDVTRADRDLARLPADPLPTLPAEVIPYLWPSRYCDSHAFEPWVRRRFAHLEGGAKVAALADWVSGAIDYVPGVSSSRTTASDTFIQRQGVCRDYAHLLIALVRAADIPARIVGAYGLGVHPPDFHAVVEVWLDGGWHLIDPTGLSSPDGLVRICHGRDAVDVSFLTVFGTADLVEQQVLVTRAE